MTETEPTTFSPIDTAIYKFDKIMKHVEMDFIND